MMMVIVIFTMMIISIHHIIILQKLNFAKLATSLCTEPSLHTVGPLQKRTLQRDLATDETTGNHGTPHGKKTNTGCITCFYRQNRLTYFNLFGNRAPFASSFGSQVLTTMPSPPELLRSTCTKSSWLVLVYLSSISTSNSWRT